MHNNIYSRAKEFNLRALRDRIDGKMPHALVGLATAAELLGKGYLAKFHPSLIIDPRDFDSMLRAAGAGTHSKRPPFDIRTITAGEVCTRCCQLLPELKSLEVEIRLLAGIRNGIVHFGEHDAQVAEKIFIPYIRYSQIILKALKIEFQDFFLEFSDLAQQSLEGSAKALDLKVSALILKGKASVAERFSGLDKKLQDSLIKTIISSYRLTQYDEDLAECPACGRSGVASGNHEVRWEADYDREGNPENAYPIVELFAKSFSCGVCGLKLETSDELDAAGMDSVIEQDDVDPSDFYDENPEHEYY